MKKFLIGLKKILFIFLIIALCCITACNLILYSLISSCKNISPTKTTEDGYEYYAFREANTDIHGVAITDFPNNEEVVIPEYINNLKIERVGYYEPTGFGEVNYYVIEPEIRMLTVEHEFVIDCIEKSNGNCVVRFPNLTTLVFNDFLYCNLKNANDEILIPHYIGKKNSKCTFSRIKKNK